MEADIGYDAEDLPFSTEDVLAYFLKISSALNSGVGVSYSSYYATIDLSGVALGGDIYFASESFYFDPNTADGIPLEEVSYAFITEPRGSTYAGIFFDSGFTLGQIAVADTREEMVVAMFSSDDSIGGTIKNDYMFSYAGTDWINGFEGDDIINGGTGKDHLSGGEGSDTFIFDASAGKANLDRLADFSVKEDEIHLDNSVFLDLIDGDLPSSQIHVKGKGRLGGDDRIIIDTGKDIVYFDQDGSGKSYGALEIFRSAEDLSPSIDFVVI